MGDLELLRTHAKMGLDERDRIVDQWGITIAVSREGQLLFVGSELPPELTAQLQEAFHASPPQLNPDVAPAALTECERLLAGANGPLSRASGPIYVIPADTRFSSVAQLTLSTDDRIEAVRGSNPGNWLSDEWDDLIEGKLGPWAMAAIGGRVISICHTPRSMADDAAECGVWTDREFRGQGHAAAVTAAWASILEPTRRHLFYGTEWGNRSSQRVAERLKLRPIGSTWSLMKAREQTGYQRHPLSKPRMSR
jgi:RimJ/RimL family protein N-acetyltransferase